MPFGYLLRRFRVEKGFSQRKLGQIVGIDHTYIDRLENRRKGPPPAEKVQKLIAGLGLAGRDAWLLGYAAECHQHIDIAMIEYALEHPEITEEQFSWAVAVKFRRAETLDYPMLFDCAAIVAKVLDCALKPRRRIGGPSPELSGVRQ